MIVENSPQTSSLVHMEHDYHFGSSFPAFRFSTDSRAQGQTVDYTVSEVSYGDPD